MPHQDSELSEIPAFGEKYQIIRRLGEGGMATVYLGKDQDLQRQVAIKVIRQDIAKDKHYITRFHREIETIKQLEHSAIVPIYDASRLAKAGEEQARPYLVMQYLSGGTLAQKLQVGPLPETEIVPIFNRIAAALDAAHKKEIVHRDLKPGNILFNEYGEAYLTDFGIVKILGDDGRSQTQGPIGTPVYMSPEQMRGLPVDGRTDIYALGVVLFEMLTGQPADTLFMARLKGSPPSVQAYNPAIREPLAYDEILDRALAEAPEGRFQTAGEMARLVAAAAQSWGAYFAAATPQATPTPQTAPYVDTVKSPDPSGTVRNIPQPTTRPGSVRWNWGIAIAGLGLLALAFVFFVWPGIQTANPTPTANTLAQQQPTNPAPTAARVPTQTVPVQTLPASPEPEIIMVLDWAASAVWQLDDALARIPADGRLSVPPNRPVQVQSSSEPIQMVLPDRTKLLLDINTLVEIALPGEASAEVRITLTQGRLLVETADFPVTITTPLATAALLPESSVGLFVSPDARQLTVDCLTSECLVQSDVSQTAANLATGQSALVAADGRIYPTPSADYSRFVMLANAISNVSTPTPTPSPTLTETTTITATPSATVPPTPLVLSFRQNRLEIGRSVNGVPIEAVQLSQGSKPVLFVGGIHAGYAPNALALVEAMITHFQAHPDQIPPGIALYVIPNLNPDSPNMPGVVDGRLNANGVDLNRNWDCRWQANNTILDQFVPNSGGGGPVSEPESQALQAFIQAIAPQTVIFWGAGGRATGLSSPGACEEISLVSAPLAQAYGRAADFNFVDGPIVQADTTLNGDVTNWLDKIGIPAAFIILPRFQDYNWEQNYAGIQAVFDVILNGALTAISPGTPVVLPTPTTCTVAPATQWATSYAAYRARLGCALSTAVTPTAAYQPYANGLMIWRQDKEQVYILYQDGTLSTHTVNDSSLASYYVSDLLKGAFGYLWQNNTAVRTRLGQPQTAEQVASAFAAQDFSNGVILTFADIGGHTYLLFFPETTWLYP